MIGGRNADGAVASVEAYADGAWTAVGSVAGARGGGAGAGRPRGGGRVTGGANAPGAGAAGES